jgi:FAD/FMN-containing dehydrogenase
MAKGTSEVDLVKPLSLEYFDHGSLDIQRVKATDVPANARAAILFEQSVSEEKLYDCLAQWNNLFESHHVVASWLPMDHSGKEKLTEFRHSLPEGINSYVRTKGTHKVATDIAVPGERFEEMTNFHEQVGLEMQIKRILDDLSIQYDAKAFESLSLDEKVRLLEEKAGTGSVPVKSSDERSALNMQHYELLADRVDAVRRSKGAEVAYAIFGHIGDYHLHFNFLPRSATELDEMKKAAIRLARKAIELRGTITAEHGVGKKTYQEGGVDKSYLEIMYGRQGLESIAAIKDRLDPNWILNPGNVVTASYSKQT